MDYTFLSKSFMARVVEHIVEKTDVFLEGPRPWRVVLPYKERRGSDRSLLGPHMSP